MELLNTISNNRTWNRHGLKIAYAIAILLCLLCISSIAWSIYSQSKIKSVNYADQKIAPIKQRQKLNYNVHSIVKANLFGNPNPAPVQRVVSTTTLDLTLQGVLSASSETLARAIIRSGNKKSKVKKREVSPLLTPLLTKPKVRMYVEPDKIQGNKYIESHRIWVIESTPSWTK